MFRRLVTQVSLAILSVLPLPSLVAAEDANSAAFAPINLFNFERARIIEAADAALGITPISITTDTSPLSQGGKHDFYSNGDYWWPDPQAANGIPYIRRDGQSNPNIFNAHRMAIRNLRDAVAALAAAAKLTNNPVYVAKAASLLDVFFVNPSTSMHPHLRYAQAIPGVSNGRGIGIIDTLHLVEIPMAVDAIKEMPGFPRQTKLALYEWFKHYLDWMRNSENGQEEARERNNHAVAYWLQVAVLAKFTDNQKQLQEVRQEFKTQFLAKQMALDGSFPEELLRTKPYAYSIFQLENITTLSHILSTTEDNLWQFKLADGRGIEKALDFMMPFLADKTRWPFKQDIQAWESWPVRQSALLFAGMALQRADYLHLWRTLPATSENDEVKRNIAITQPLLWMSAIQSRP